MADLCGAENAALVVADTRLGYSSVVTPRADPDVVSAYAKHWWLFAMTAPRCIGSEKRPEDDGLHPLQTKGDGESMRR